MVRKAKSTNDLRSVVTNIRVSPPLRRVFWLMVLVALVLTLSVQLLRVSDPEALKRSERSSEAPILTIWTILRELEHPAIDRHHGSQQSWLESFHTYNAITSWGLLPGVNIIMFGDESSCAFALPFAPNSVCLPIPCIHPEFGVPQYDCLFAKAAEMANTEFLMYSNSDMLYFDDLLKAVDVVSAQHDDFLMIGRRTDIMYPRMVDFSDPLWVPKLRQHVIENGELHGKYGIDYFLYRTRYSRAMPPFLVGRIRWDNWLVAQFIGGKDSVAIDSTKVVLAVHLNHMHVGGSHSRSGTEYNVDLTKGSRVDPKKIGDLDSADYSLQPTDLPPKKHNIHYMGECPKCSLKKNAQSLDVMLYKHSTNDSIIVSTVNSGYLDFALNWLCSLQRAGVRNYLFHAADIDMFNTLSSMGLPAFFFESDKDKEYRVETGADARAHVYGSVSYQGLMNTRTEFIYKIMQKGYNVLLCDVDILFLRNPFPHFDYSLDIQGGAHKGVKITGGFIYFRATEPAKKIWMKVLTMHREMFEKIQTMPDFNPHSMTEQELVNNLLLASKPEEIKWGVVKEHIIADGKRFFIDRETQKKGEWPVAIHNNYIVGSDNKRARFQNISMWLVDEDLSCRKFPHYIAPAPKGPPSMVIKILAFDRPKALLRLLKSLTAADFLGDHIPLDFYIDYPDEEHENDPETLTNRRMVVVLAEKFQWTHGPKRVIVRNEHYGLANQWLNSWFPVSDSETCLFLEDDNIVSPLFYPWLKAATLKYFHDPTQYDGRLFGIMMQHQHMIPGNYPHKPSEFLSPDTRFFKYQILSTWGPLFFPHQWTEFLTWYGEKSADPEFMPLFSNMITNTWFLSRGGGRSVWSAWFMRFTAERGLYAVYTNFDDGSSLVVNYRDKGVNYKEDKGPNSPMVEVLEPYMVNFPDSKDLPLYDFHFNLVTEDPSILEERAIYADIYNHDFH